MVRKSLAKYKSRGKHSVPMSLHHLKEFDTYMGLSTRGSDRYGANTSWTAAGFDTDFFDFGP